MWVWIHVNAHGHAGDCEHVEGRPGIVTELLLNPIPLYYSFKWCTYFYFMQMSLLQHVYLCTMCWEAISSYKNPCDLTEPSLYLKQRHFTWAMGT